MNLTDYWKIYKNVEEVQLNPTPPKKKKKKKLWSKSDLESINYFPHRHWQTWSST